MTKFLFRLNLILVLGCALLMATLPTTHAAPLADGIVITVNSGGDAPDADATDDICETASGNSVCTLRAAIQTANRDADTDTIRFDLATALIEPDSNLPVIISQIILDGTNISDNGRVELNGGSIGYGGVGLHVTSGGSDIKGFAIRDFTHGEIVLETGGGNIVRNNYIGTDVTGMIGAGGALASEGLGGIMILNSADNVIGGENAGDLNLISGSDANGVLIEGAGSTNNQVVGNHIGTDITGLVALPNAADPFDYNEYPEEEPYILGGVMITSASNNTIKNNLISGNGRSDPILGNGVVISGTTASDNVLEGNMIGLDATGNEALPNSKHGVLMLYPGASRIGGPSASQRNVISGNGDNGIEVAQPTDEIVPLTTIQGNYIGTNAAGTAAIGNGRYGIFAYNNALIGGDTAAEGNLISGNNGGIGPIFFSTIKHNRIGINAAGDGVIPNVGGIDVSGGTNNLIRENVISGNQGNGIVVSSPEAVANANNRIEANLIGLQPDGVTPAGNATFGQFFAGINIQGGHGTRIGGTNAADANIIAHNGGDGIIIRNTQAGGYFATANPILGNSIFENSRLGINIGTDDVTANDEHDVDSGDANIQNFPGLDSADAGDNQVTLTGTLDSIDGSYRIEFFANPTCDSSGNGEGKQYLGQTEITVIDNAGTIDVTLNASVTSGEFVTATATDSNNNTSEFSECVQITGDVVNLGTYFAYDLDGEDYYGSFSPYALNNERHFVYSLNGLGYLRFNQVDIELGLLPDGEAQVLPQDVNEQIQVVGSAMVKPEGDEYGSMRAFLWQAGEMIQLATVGGELPVTSSQATAINEAGVIVGREVHGNAAGEDLGGVVKWENGGTSASFLPSAPNCLRFCGADQANDISNSGYIVGSSAVDDYGPPFGYCCDHAARWQNGVLTMLDTEMDTDSMALDGNEEGKAVGFKRFFQTGYLTVPMLWSGAGGGTNLLSNGFDSGEATSINNQGVVVGSAYDYDGTCYPCAFIWKQGAGMVDLNTLLDPTSTGWILESAVEINDNGDIIGYGRHMDQYGGYQGSGYLLSHTLFDNIGTGTPLVVNSTSDKIDANVGDGECETQDNDCSLRAAIMEANADADTTKIYFNLECNGCIPTIKPNPSLPEIVHPVIIDGASQQNCTTPPCGERVELSGENDLSADAKGLYITAGESTISGLVVNRFKNIGIYLKTKGGNKIEGNFIGTDTTGTQRRPNENMGILIYDSPNNTIGGTTAAQRNIISGNGTQESCANATFFEGVGESGITIRGTGSRANLVQGNYIGTDVTGTQSVYNMCIGVGVGDDANSNTIGGTTEGARNIISGNSHPDPVHPPANVGTGIVISSVLEPTSGNIVLGNYIGTDVNGTAALPNVDGLYINARNTTIGGTTNGASNLISGNEATGLLLALGGGPTLGPSTGVKVLGNIIGLDKTGTSPVPNKEGIYLLGGRNTLIGGKTEGSRNLISGNTETGILIDTIQADAANYKIQGNSIGTDATGTADLGNGEDGIAILGNSVAQIFIGGKNNGEANLIAFNGDNGILAANATGETIPPAVAIRGNSMWSNDAKGIEVVPAGTTPSVNFTQHSDSRMKIKGTLSAPEQANKSFTLDFFANAACDGSAGEGQTYLGSTTVTTDGSGSASYEYLVDSVPSDSVITATATREGKSTGQFSNCRNKTQAAPQAYVAAAGDCAGNEPCYDDINDAIDAADPDGTVNIAPGMYNGDILLNGDVQLNMGEESGGGGGGDNFSNRVAGKREANAQENADDYILNGSLTILDGSFQAPGTNLYITGNLTLGSEGNFSNNGGTIIFNGSGTQNINGDFEFNNLRINSGVTANAQSGATYVNGEFVNQGVAKNTRTSDVNDPDYFEIFQDLAGRRSVGLLNTGNPDLGSMTVTTTLNQAPQTSCDPNGLPQNTLARWYNIERANGDENGINATLRVYYDAAELNGALVETLKLYHCDENTGQWNALTTSAGSDYNGDYLQAENVSSFSPFGIGSGNGAPTNVTLSKFKAKARKKGTVNVAWRTETELNVLGFTIMRAEQHGEFAPLNSELIPAKNIGSIGTTNYKFHDKTVSAGKRYNYRLEVVLVDGSHEASEIRQVKIPAGSCAQPAVLTLLSPANGAKVKHKVLLDWSDATCAGRYELKVRRGKQKQEIVNDNTLTASGYTLDKLTKGKYQWRVRACNDSSCGEWTKWADFAAEGKKKE